MMNKAAVIVHGRTRYTDYRQKFLVRPVDMEDDQIYHWKALIQRCTGSPEEMRETHCLRRAVIAADGYAAAGIAGYFRDIYPASFEDEGMRPVQGFVGFIWKTEDLPKDGKFPRLQAFRSAIEEYVIPRWEEPKNSPDGEMASFSDYRDRRDGAEEADWTEDEDAGLTQALRRACTGENVFYCTGLPEEPLKKQAEDAGDSTAVYRSGVHPSLERENRKTDRRTPARKSGGTGAAVYLAVAVLAAVLCLSVGSAWARLAAGFVTAASLLACGWRLSRAVRSRKRTLPDLPADEIRELLNGAGMREEENGGHGDDMYQL